MALATFLHLSDLHFGIPGDQTELGASLPVVHHLVGGLFGHDANALKAIPRLLDARGGGLTLPTDTQVLFTGDLTRVGASKELETGGEYFSDGIKLGKSFGGIGLYKKNWQTKAVSGNHDQWPGTSIYRFTLPAADEERRTAFKDAFGTTRTPTVFDVPNSRYRIRFIRIDTDADTNRIQRLLGWGHFQSQLHNLAQNGSDLPPYEDTFKEGVQEIRVLLLHHALRTGGRLPLFLRIHPRSKRALKAFIKQHRVSVVLSGHIHEPEVLRHSHEGWDYLDARCGTSAQGPPKRDTNGSEKNIAQSYCTPRTALVHTLTEEDSRLRWSTTTYVFAPDVEPNPESPTSLNRDRQNRLAFIDYRNLQNGRDKPWSGEIPLTFDQ